MRRPYNRGGTRLRRPFGWLAGVVTRCDLGTIDAMRILALAVLGTLLLCSCRTRSTANDPTPSAVANTTPVGNTSDPLPSPDTSRANQIVQDTITHIPEVVWRYRTAWDRIHATQGPVRLPEFWALADSASKALIPTMEQFTEATFQRAESLMVWHNIERIEILSASPVYDSFLTLARVRGTPSDTAYFSYFATEEKGGWKTQVTDYSACDELGSPNLLTSLVGAERLRADSANPYRNRLPDPAGDLRSSIGYGLCTCGKAPATLRNFAKNRSQVAVPPSLRPLLDSLGAILRAPRSNDRFECSPG